jgi:predicted Zn finger-like uncharacterized protein
MRINCPTCDTSYQIAGGSLGATGRKVRCARCGTTWYARPYEEPPVDETAAEIEWAAVEGRADGVPGPNDEDWRAALDEPEAPVPGGGGAFPMDEAEEPPPGATFEEHRELAGEDARTGSAGTSGGGRARRRAGATIEAEPPGFDRRRSASRQSGRRDALMAPGFGMRVVTAMIVTMASVILAGMIAGSLFAREAMVRRFPDLASVYALAGAPVNLRGLDFEAVTTYREVDGATPVLVVEGIVRNVTTEARPVPRLRFGLLSNTGREVYAWSMDASEKRLESGATVRFKSRLPAPPDAAVDVAVRFTDRRGP